VTTTGTRLAADATPSDNGSVFQETGRDSGKVCARGTRLDEEDSDGDGGAIAAELSSFSYG
jgi:hypothetical protein